MFLGGEFYNAKVKALLKEHNVKLYSTHNEPKSCIAERFIRTLRDRIEHAFIIAHNNWTYVLPKIMRDYNSKIHRSIHMSPMDARLSKNYKKVYKSLYDESYKKMTEEESLKNPNVQKRMPKYEVGQKVRISLHKRLFEKSSTAKWSEEVFFIDEINQNTRPITYLLKDYAGEKLTGGFYPEQLQPTNASIYRIEKVLKKRVKNGRHESFVKWQGYPKKFNSWVESDEISTSLSATSKK